MDMKITKLSQIRQHVNKNESIIQFAASNWVQPDVQYMQLLIHTKTTQFINAGDVVVISNEAALSVFLYSSYKLQSSALNRVVN